MYLTYRIGNKPNTTAVLLDGRIIGHIRKMKRGDYRYEPKDGTVVARRFFDLRDCMNFLEAEDGASNEAHAGTVDGIADR